jgi:hypothetical protein
MPTQVQFRRGTTAQNNAFTGAVGELSVDTDLDVIRVHDGSTAGGFALVGANSTQTLTNKTLSSPTITGATITGTTARFDTSITTSTLNTGTLNANSTATVNALTSNGAVTGTTGTFTTSTTTSALNTGTLNANSTATVASLTANGNITLGGNIIDTGAIAIQTGSNGNINLEPNGTGVIVVTKDIRNGQANATGNIGSSTNYFNTIFAKATSAQYADLAERYQADAVYEAGTVLVFGGEFEVTQSYKDHDTSIAGVVSTDPAYIMNATLQTPNSVAVALAGRVPCKVLGPVNKGTVLVTSHLPGTAQAIDYTKAKLGAVIGKAMQNIADNSVKTIEISVGRN